MFIEMSRNEGHGGGTWAFPNCVWSPTEKKGGGTWPFWSKILHVQEGDIVIHLRGIHPNAEFVGYSTASGNGFETDKKPPDPDAWSYSNRFYRADLKDFTAFHESIRLVDLFDQRRAALDSYFDLNKSRGRNKLNLFYVRQSGRLQCQNGAYLSDVDSALFEALFGVVESLDGRPRVGEVLVTVPTGNQLTSVYSRLGQRKFSDSVKEMYGNRCCFPDCDVTDVRFLVGAHIARWSDNADLRGHMGNGLCFCVLHDKAFELGIFTLDADYCVYVNPREHVEESGIVVDLKRQQGHRIALGKIPPLDDAILEHWERVGISP